MPVQTVDADGEGKLAPTLSSTARRVDTTTSRRLFIKDRKTKTQYLIDSGADFSVIPPTNRNTPHQMLMYAANGSPIKCYGTKIISVDLGLRRQMTWEFVIADVTKPIIGADFLYEYDLLIDVRRKKLIDKKTKLEVSGIECTTESE